MTEPGHPEPTSDPWAGARAVNRTTSEPTSGQDAAAHSHGFTIDLPPSWTDPPTIAFTATSVAQSMRATGFEAAEIVRCNPGDAADQAASLDSVALH